MENKVGVNLFCRQVRTLGGRRRDFFFLLNPWYDFRYMTSTPRGPTTAFGKNPMANKNPKQNTTKEIKS